jgi:hypothetical protein
VSTVSDFFEFLDFLVNGVSFMVGLFIGLLTLAFTPLLFRVQRRHLLRREWKKDKPGVAEPGLYPEWQKYDPDIPGIDRKCICHHRVIHPGEQVLTWPEIGPMNLLYIAVYCESVKERLWDGQ